MEISNKEILKKLDVIDALAVLLEKYNLTIYPAFYLRGADAVIMKKDDFFVVLRISNKCDVEDIRQVLKGAKKFEEEEGEKPNVLAIYACPGEISQDALNMAEKYNIIVERSLRRLARRIASLLEK